MDDDATVSAADIARLARVGRAAVSNWRRRYPDFPQPVGGSASSPLFALDAVTDWFRARGKKFELTAAERAWQRLRALGDDLELGVRVAAAGTFLAFEHGLTDTFDAALEDAELLTLLSELARETGPAEAFELLCHRFFEAHSRRLSTTPEPIAELMVRLTGHAGTVLDPACGVGSLVLAGGADQVLAQDSDPATGERAPSTLLLAESGPDLSTVDELWQEFTRAPESGTRIIDLLDDDIDLTPALHRAGPPDPALEFLALQEKFASMAVVPPRLSEDDAEPAYTTIGELAKAGVVEVRHAPAKTTPGEETLLTVDDLAAGRPPSGRAGADRAHVVAAEGDVIASVTGIARVHNGPEVRLGPALSLYRADPGRLDPEFLAGCLRAAELPATSGSTRIDARRV